MGQLQKLQYGLGGRVTPKMIWESRSTPLESSKEGSNPMTKIPLNPRSSIIQFDPACKGPCTQMLSVGAWCKKKNCHKNFCPPLWTLKKKNQDPPIFPWKLWDSAIERHVNCKLSFHWKICGKSQKFQGPSFFISLPPPKVLVIGPFTNLRVEYIPLNFTFSVI